ncbi:MAG: hypothetical protein ACNS62_22125 [Candidatus Cyclobacteriaceae bacterium M3_2C_046]
MKDKQNKILARYLIGKLKSQVKNIRIRELEDFFNENGWLMYDLDTMTHKFKAWRQKQV